MPFDDFATRYLSALRDRDYETLGQCYADDIEYSDVPAKVTFDHQGIMDAWRRVESTWAPGCDYVLVSSLTDGGRYVIEAEMRGTPLEQDGRPKEPVVLRFVMIGDVEDGKIVRNKDYYDPADVHAAAGTSD